MQGSYVGHLDSAYRLSLDLTVHWCQLCWPVGDIMKDLQLLVA